MTTLRTIFFVAVLSGLAAGVVMTALQTVFTVPLILEAETYEMASSAADHTHADDDGADAAHSHDEAWAPEDGFERFVYTALANIVAGVGFALLLVGLSEFAGGIGNWLSGIHWGLAGFAAFTLAPGLGLPPELPGMPAADLLARQSWWLLCVAATGAGLAGILLGRTPALAAVGVALLVLPHVVGAPMPEDHGSDVPADLHHRFVVAVTMTNLLFWVALGTAVALIRPRFVDSTGVPQRRVA